MRLVVPLRVELGIGEPEVRRQVDDRADLLAQLGDDPLCSTVRQREEHEVEPLADVWLVLREDEVRIGRREARVARRSELARLRLPRCHHDLEPAMKRAQAQQLCARVARRPDDADPLADHERMIIRSYALSCKDKRSGRRPLRAIAQGRAQPRSCASWAASTAAMHRARTSPTSASVSVWSPACSLSAYARLRAPSPTDGPR